jgi:DNA invertase Pin-like site-specific DNA recombinase
MSRIGADHLARAAIVYVRQSTVDQVINNVESRRRQYALVERARQLGWADRAGLTKLNSEISGFSA